MLSQELGALNTYKEHRSVVEVGCEKLFFLAGQNTWKLTQFSRGIYIEDCFEPAVHQIIHAVLLTGRGMAQ